MLVILSFVAYFSNLQVKDLPLFQDGSETGIM